MVQSSLMHVELYNTLSQVAYIAYIIGLQFPVLSLLFCSKDIQRIVMRLLVF